MDELKMVKERHSVRSYLDKKIEPEKVALIRAEIDDINARSGLNMQFSEEADGVFDSLISRFIGWKYVPSYVLLMGKDEAGLDERCGYWGERLVLFLQSVGLNTCWVGMFRKNAVKLSAGEDERMVITIAVGYGADSGKPHRSKNISDVTDVQDMPDWFKAGLECALLAPTAVNQQKFMFTLENDKPAASVNGKGPFTEVDLGIVKYHFELGSGRKL